jgi:hypothetical protein
MNAQAINAKNILPMGDAVWHAGGSGAASAGGY